MDHVLYYHTQHLVCQENDFVTTTWHAILRTTGGSLTPAVHVLRYYTYKDTRKYKSGVQASLFLYLVTLTNDQESLCSDVQWQSQTFH